MLPQLFAEVFDVPKWELESQPMNDAAKENNAELSDNANQNNNIIHNNNDEVKLQTGTGQWGGYGTCL